MWEDTVGSEVGSTFQWRMEAASAVHGFGTWRLNSLLSQLVLTQTAAEPRVRCFVLLIERSCGDSGEVKEKNHFKVITFLSEPVTNL